MPDEHFGCSVPHCATVGVGTIICVFEDFGEAKVDNFAVAFPIYHAVFGFDVSLDYEVAVQKL